MMLRTKLASAAPRWMCLHGIQYTYTPHTAALHIPHTAYRIPQHCTYRIPQHIQQEDTESSVRTVKDTLFADGLVQQTRFPVPVHIHIHIQFHPCPCSAPCSCSCSLCRHMHLGPCPGVPGDLLLRISSGPNQPCSLSALRHPPWLKRKYLLLYRMK
jgi:hypothetical protein